MSVISGLLYLLLMIKLTQGDLHSLGFIKHNGTPF